MFLFSEIVIDFILCEDVYQQYYGFVLLEHYIDSKITMN